MTRSAAGLVVVVVVALACGLAGACGPEVRTYERDGLAIHHVVAGITNTFLVENTSGERGLMIVDVGGKDDANNVLAGLDRIGKKPSDVTLVFCTHGHFDHCGAGAAIRDAIDAPLAVGAGDVEGVKAGKLGPNTALILEGSLLQPFWNTEFPAFDPDLALAGDGRLDDFGIPGSYVATPGHTPGSVSILLDSGDAFVGDLIRGVDEGAAHDPAGDDGHLGNAGTGYYSDDADADAAHLDDLLGRGATTFFPGHGAMFEASSLRGWVADHLPPG